MPTDEGPQSQAAPTKLKLLKITCTSTDCEKGLHCFKQSRKMKAANQRGQCRTCGADLIDWNRLKKNDLADIDYAFSALKQEFIRHHFWHEPLDEKAVNYARRKGRIKLNEAARRRIEKSVGPANPSFDGRQTGKSENPIFYAQHATASCCRKCIQEWHGFPMGEELTENQIFYLTALVQRFLDERLPALSEISEKVPSVRTAKKQ